MTELAIALVAATIAGILADQVRAAQVRGLAARVTTLERMLTASPDKAKPKEHPVRRTMWG